VFIHPLNVNGFFPAGSKQISLLMIALNSFPSFHAFVYWWEWRNENPA